jgi:hypothetical protein
VRQKVRRYVLSGKFERHMDLMDGWVVYIAVGIIVAAAVLFAPILCNIIWRQP